MSWKLQYLPLHEDVESKTVLRKVAEARSALAELKGVAPSIPNEAILINTLSLQEAKDSSEVENIITTHDELYRSQLNLKKEIESSAAKEVQNYVSALKMGFSLVKKKNVLTNNDILVIQETLEKNNAGFRSVPGTNLQNEITKEIIYTPPQDSKEIINLMVNLEAYINDNEMCDMDPLIKMAIIHHQFESIHPFYDGNGRTGRIVNILYLVLNKLLDLPILYLSRYIIQNKSEYYKLLQSVRENGEWESWILYILDAIEKTAKQTIELITELKELMQIFKLELRLGYKFYSQELLNNLFKHPYTKISFLMDDLGITRQTASVYLKDLVQDGLLEMHQVHRTKFYINTRLFELLHRERKF
ncbi:MAG: Fic family protein [Crocinitomicaceae bacterium]|nr:Fic family protein [Crocinitomicaceae bacterium]